MSSYEQDENDDMLVNDCDDGDYRDEDGEGDHENEDEDGEIEDDGDEDEVADEQIIYRLHQIIYSCNMDVETYDSIRTKVTGNADSAAFRVSDRSYPNAFFFPQMSDEDDGEVVDVEDEVEDNHSPSSFASSPSPSSYSPLSSSFPQLHLHHLLLLHHRHRTF
ncbi:hypothetical protein Tco_0931180 [Tanacetum coccineum]